MQKTACRRLYYQLTGHLAGWKISKHGLLVVINKCKNFLKKQRCTLELTDNLEVFYDMPISELEMMEAICSLNPKLSMYITLRFYNDMTYEEVAVTLKQLVSTVKYRTKKALEELKNFLEG